jgi:hypothetical protein
VNSGVYSYFIKTRRSPFPSRHQRNDSLTTTTKHFLGQIDIQKKTKNLFIDKFFAMSSRLNTIAKGISLSSNMKDFI